MGRKKISDKFKIIAAVLAVIVVASVFAAFDALSSNSGDTQDSLLANANGDNGADTAVMAENVTKLNNPTLTFWDDEYEYDGNTHSGSVSVSGASGAALELKITGKYIDDGTDMDGDGITVNGLSFTVVNAGNYTAYVKIADGQPYEWTNASDVDEQGYKTVRTFSIKRLQLTRGDVPFYFAPATAWDAAGFARTDWSPDSSNMFIKYKPNLRSYAGQLYYFAPEYDELDLSNVRASVGFYRDANCTQSIDGELQSGKIYVRAESLYGVDGDSTYRNFILPSTKPSDSFTVKQIELAPVQLYATNFTEPIFSGLKPTVNRQQKTISANYLGVDYTIVKFFDTDDWAALGSGEYINITVDGEPATGNTALRNVKRNASSGAVEAYQIKFSIKDSVNYTWSSGGSDTTYRLTINPHSISSTYVNWIDQEYTGKAISFKNSYTMKRYNEQTREVGLFGDDQVGLVIDDTYYASAIPDKDGEGNIVGYHFPSIVNGGSYRTYIVGLTGRDAGNYTLPPLVLGDDVPAQAKEHITSTIGFDHIFHVTKKVLNVPTGTIIGADGTLTFDGSIIEIDVFDILKEMGLLVEDEKGNITSLFVANILMDGEVLGNTTAYLGKITEFNVDKVIFRTNRAGRFSAQMVLTSLAATSFAWKDTDGTTIDWIDFAIVNKVEVPPIVLEGYAYRTGTTPTSEENPTEIKTALENFIAANNLGNILEIVGFGKEGQTNVNTIINADDKSPYANPRAFDSTNGKYVKGEYFALVRLIYGTENSSFTDVNHFTELENGYAKISYAVRDNLLNISFTANGYTYGDVPEYSQALTLHDPDNLTTGAPAYKIYTTYAGEDLSGELEGGVLPTEAGTYYVVMTVALKDGGEFKNSDPVPLTVAPRAVTLGWTVDGLTVAGVSSSVPFNGQPHTVAAMVTNAVGSDTVIVTLDAGELTNADEYVINATLNNSNYTVDGGTNVTFTLTVTAVEITVTAGDYVLTYGTTLDISKIAKTVTGSLINSGDANNITLYVYQDGVRVTNLTNLAKGTYDIVPVWNDDFTDVNISNGQYVTTRDNYRFTMIVGTLTVQAQRLTVTFNDGICEGKYGQDHIANLRGHIASIKDENNQSVTVEALTFALVGQNNIATAPSSDTAYSVTVSLVGAYNDSYTLVVTGGTAQDDGSYVVANKYKIAFGQVTITVQDVTAHPFNSVLPLQDTEYFDIEGLEVSALSYPKIVAVSKTVSSNKYLTRDPSKISVGTGNYVLGVTFRFNNVASPGYTGNSISKEYVTVTGDNFTYSFTIGNYRFTVNTGKFTVVPATLNVTFKGSSTINYGESVKMYADKNGRNPDEEWTTEAKNAYMGNLEYLLFTLSANARGDDGKLSGNLGGNLNWVREIVTFKFVNKQTNVEYPWTEDMESLPAGEYEIHAVQGTYANFVIAENGSGTLIVKPLELHCTVSSTVTSVVYGDGLSSNPFTFTYVKQSADDVEPTDITSLVSVRIIDASNNKYALSEIAQQNADEYTVGLVCDNPNYVIICDNTLTFKITKRAITVTPEQVGTHVYGNALEQGELTASITSSYATALVNGDSFTLNLAVYSGQTDVTSTLNAQNANGNYTINVACVADEGTVAANYNINVVNTVTFTINPRPIKITAENISHAYGAALEADELTKTITTSLGTGVTAIVNGDESALNITLAVYANSNATTPIANIATQAVGDYVIKVSYVNNANYAVEVEEGTFTIQQLTARITYKTVEGGGAFGSVYGESVDLSGTYEITGLLPADVGKENVTAKLNGVDASNTSPVGTYTLIVTINPNYEVEYVNWTKDEGNGVRSGVYEITKRDVTIKANNVTNHVYGNTLGANELGYTETGIVNGDSLNIKLDVYASNGTTKITDTIAAQSVADNYVIKVSAANDNYNVKTENGTFKVIKRAITVKANDVTNHTYGEAFTGTLGYSVTSTLKVVDGDTLNLTVNVYNNNTIVTKANLSKLGVSNYEIRVEENGNNPNYAITCTNGTFTVKQRAITVKSNSVTGYVYGSTAPTLDYTVTSALKVVSGDTLDLSVNVYNGSNVVSAADIANLNVGKYAIKVTKGTNPNYNITVDETGDSQKFEVVAANITVTNKDVNEDWKAATVTYTGATFDVVNVTEHLNITTVNGMTVSLSYAVDGGAVVSVRPSFTNVGEHTVVVTISAANHNSQTVTLTHKITQATLTLKADNKSVTYGNELNTVTFSVTVDGTTGLTEATKQSYLTAANAQANFAAAGYAVTTAAGTKLNITNGYTGDGNVAVTVNNGTLTVTKRTLNVSYNSLSSTYGDSLADNVLSTLYSASGFANGDTETVTAKMTKNGVTYDLRDTNAPAGDYVVTVTASDNYNVVYENGKQTGSYKINQRLISVTSNASAEFVPDENVTNGAYGQTVNAVLTFSGADGLTVAENADYTVTYALVNGSDVTTATPNKAGAYRVTVTLKQDGNYVLAGNEYTVELQYEITKIKLLSANIIWEKQTITLQGEEDGINVLVNYDNTIMRIASFTRSTARVEESEEIAEDNYEFDGKQLCINVSDVSNNYFYSVTFVITAEASANYEFTDVDSNGKVTKDFTVTSDKISTLVLQNGWQYGDSRPEIVFTIHVGENETPYSAVGGLTYTFAVVTKSQYDRARQLIAEKTVDGSKNLDLAEIEGLYDASTFLPISSYETFDVGYYIVCVSYSGEITDGEGNNELLAIRGCDVFEVAKKQLAAPAIESNLVYKGQAQSPAIDYNVGGMDLSTLVTAAVTPQTNVGVAYTAKFTINDPERYVWATKVGSDTDSVKTLIWAISTDTADNGTNEYFTLTVINSVTYGTAVALPTLTAKAGYEGTFTWYYAEKGSMASATQVEDSAWSTIKPTQAGEYFVKAVLSDNSGYNNFSDKVSYGAFTINKAALTLTPSGSLTYGEAFDDSKCSYTLSGFLNGETQADVTLTGTIEYSVVGETNVTKLPYNKDNYAITATFDFVATNYTVTLATNYGRTFEVKPLKVKVTIGNVSSEYGMPVDISKVVVSADKALATSEVVTEISVAKGTLTTTATATANKGKYPITTDYKNANFDIEYQFGEYEITPRVVNVTLQNSGTGYSFVYGSTEDVSIEGVKGSDNNDVTGFIADKLTLTVVYSGTANNGTTLNGSTAHPTLAGSYSVTVTATAKAGYDLNNFAFSAATVSYEVAKFVVTVANITAQATVYTGDSRTPEKINDVNTYPYGQTNIYNVIYNSADLVAAGEHSLTLEFVEEHGSNYAWDTPVTATTATIKFVIKEASIFAIPMGELKYGDNFENAKFGVRYVNAKGEEISGVTGNVTYVLVGYDNVTSNGNNSSLRLNVGDYELTLAVDVEGFVEGVSLNNYKISLKYEQGAVVYGKLSVLRRELRLQAGNSQSVYGQDVVVSQAYTLVDGLVNGDDLATVVKNYVATTTAEKGSPVANSYVVSATADADNYIITVLDGVYEITQLYVKANVSAKNGVYMDADNAVVIAVNGIAVTLPNIYSFPADFADKFIVKITGNANDGIGFSEQGLLNEVARPVAAGTYTVTIVAIADSNFKFDEQSSEAISAEFTVDKASVTLTPSGSLTYGQTFSQGEFSYVLNGFKNGENSSVVRGELTKASYLLADDTVNANRLNVNANGYALTVAVNADGYVEGLAADNYNISVVQGVLSVSKRAITIRPLPLSSVYTQPTLSSTDFEVVGEGFAFDDNKTAINYRATVHATQGSPVGEYDITVDETTYANNYEITSEKGVYTVNKAKLAVTICGRLVHYGDNYTSIVEIIDIEVVDKDLLNLGVSATEVNSLEFVISYSITPNGASSPLPTTNKVPQYAGRCMVQVEGVANNDNFELDYGKSLLKTVVEILRKEVDAGKISAKSEAFTGYEITTPVIIDNTYNVDNKMIYTASHTGRFVNVGTYTLTLTLTDTDNYCWLGNLNSTTTIPFEIVKADNYLLDQPGSSGGANAPKIKIDGWTFGESANRPVAYIAGGSSNNIIYEYATSQDGVYTTDAPRDAGTYWVRATMASSDNYNAFVSEAVSFTIEKRVVTAPTWSKTSEEERYTGALIYSQLNNYDGKLMHLEYNGMSRINNDGTATLSALDAGVYTAVITLADATNYVWADGSALTNNAVTISWEIKPQLVAKPTLGNQKLFAGGNVEFIPDGFNSGIMNIEGNVHPDSGSGTAVITLKDTKNFVWEDNSTGFVTVTYNVGINVTFIAIIGVVSGLSVGLAVMAVILTVVHRHKKRREQEAMDERSRADGWNN